MRYFLLRYRLSHSQDWVCRSVARAAVWFPRLWLTGNVPPSAGKDQDLPRSQGDRMSRQDSRTNPSMPRRQHRPVSRSPWWQGPRWLRAFSSSPHWDADGPHQVCPYRRYIPYPSGHIRWPWQLHAVRLRSQLWHDVCPCAWPIEPVRWHCWFCVRLCG